MREFRSSEITAIKDIHNGSTPGRRIGLTVGITEQIPLLQEDDGCLFFAPEILYSQEGERGFVLGMNDKGTFYQDYLALPLMLKFYPKDLKSFYIEYGHKLSYMIYQKSKDIDWAEPNKFDVAACFGMGFNFGSFKNFGLGARFSLGLLDVYPEVKGLNFNIGGAITLSYMFGK
ncbi:MAG: PorT family protein [Prevotellaceae bacterium]|nr:PorT family protein [Prevotellaceae bacterium]